MLLCLIFQILCQIEYTGCIIVLEKVSRSPVGPVASIFNEFLKFCTHVWWERASFASSPVVGTDKTHLTGPGRTGTQRLSVYSFSNQFFSLEFSPEFCRFRSLWSVSIAICSTFPTRGWTTNFYSTTESEYWPTVGNQWILRCFVFIFTVP